MARIIVISGIDDLASDMAKIPPRAMRDMISTVREGIKVGNTVAKDYARVSSRKHARKYPGTFTSKMNGIVSFGGVNGISGEYGPEHRGQGELAPILENGSRNNPAHLNLVRSADLIGPSFAQEVSRLPDRWFW